LKYLLFSVGYIVPRKAKKFPSGCEGHRTRSSGKLGTFLSHEAAEADLMAKETTITIESKSLLILRSRSTTRAWCPRCGAHAEMILLETGLLPEYAPALAQWLNSGTVHRVESADGSSLVCLDSLLAFAQKHQTR